MGKSYTTVTRGILLADKTIRMSIPIFLPLYRQVPKYRQVVTKVVHGFCRWKRSEGNTMRDKLPVAEYLRRSTEHQQYSMENQRAVIAAYAEDRNFSVVKTYTDGTSGVVLKRRIGLRQLLQDVMSGDASYRAILVYDVSRWGRFQDNDESAHYEFLCKSAGVPVHYCAEMFTNDGSLPSSLMKALKRAMAGEYSRELGVKVFNGQKRLAELGFKQGGPPGYGFRRMLVASDRKAKQLLEKGERKNIATDRVLLVPGPANEIKEVHEIYRRFTIERWSLKGIARDLNLRKIRSPRNATWTHSVVRTILSHPRYVGCNVFNQTTGRLGAQPVARPRTEWIICTDAHQGIVDPPVFAKAQEILAANRKTNEQLLSDLRSLLKSEGKLSGKIVDESRATVCSRTLLRRFGCIQNAYELIGYKK
jgi:DNA invertase Pin-like site-specific DNA recombinase